VTPVSCDSFSKDVATIEDVTPGTGTACSPVTSSILGVADETVSGGGSYEAFGPGAVGTTTFVVDVPSGTTVTQLDVVMRVFVCNGDDGSASSTIAAQRLDGSWQTLATTAGQPNFAFWSPTFTLSPASSFVPAGASSFPVRVRMTAGAIGANDIDWDRAVLDVTTVAGAGDAGGADSATTDSTVGDSTTTDSTSTDSATTDSSATDSTITDSATTDSSATDSTISDSASDGADGEACVPITSASCAPSQCGQTIPDGCGGSVTCSACPVGGLSCASSVVNPASHPFTEVTVTQSGTWVATFTVGARTVSVKGPSARTLRELVTPTGAPSITITHDTYVRLWPEALGWAGSCVGGALDAKTASWLASARADASDDVLSIAMQYTNGGPMDAQYSPGEVQPGADMTDYRQQTLFSAFDQESEDPYYPEWGPGYMDCSGYMREIWAYRLGYAWHVRARRPSDTYSYAHDGAIWKLSEDQFFNGPGVVVSDYPKDSSGQPAWDVRNVQYDVLRIGDLLFFHTTSSDDVTHVGLYMGATDGTGKRRVLSSRFYLNGPSINRSTDDGGSQQGDSIIDGDPSADRLTSDYRASRRF
jgi:hypothetical protein